MKDLKWQANLENRYDQIGWEALRLAQDAFQNRLEKTCEAHGWRAMDSHPEGRDWMLLLTDGSELYVERRSYDLAHGGTLWVEYEPERGGVVVESFGSRGERLGLEVIVSNEEITAACDRW